MQGLETENGTRTTVDETLESLSRTGFCGLSFPASLEARFETDTCKARCDRMWFEGLVAILGLNACLMLDYSIVKDLVWLSIVRHTAVITPFALAINWLVKRNPAAWLREGSVAAAMVGICVANLMVQGVATTTATLFGSICTLIAALFAGVVMRLRFPYVAASLSVMLAVSLWSLRHASSLNLSASVVGSSLMVIGLGIILIASHSLEREERRSYLLCFQRDLQAAELATTNAALERLSSVDKLTGLPNRRAFEHGVEKMWVSCARKGEWLSAVVIDVDHFKRVNDLHGHLYGDETLRRIGTLLPQALRSADDMAARFGGEEFVLLLAHADGEMAATVAERARRLVEAAGTPLHGSSAHSNAMWVTVSCGVSSCRPDEALEWTGLIAAADEALYAAKRGGRNRVEFGFCNPLGSAGSESAELPVRETDEMEPRTACASWPESDISQDYERVEFNPGLLPVRY